MPTAEQFREELSSVFQEAVGANRSTVEVNAGELHRWSYAHRACTYIRRDQVKT